LDLRYKDKDLRVSSDQQMGNIKDGRIEKKQYLYKNPNTILWTHYIVTSHHITSHHITSHLITSHLITSHLITSHHITSHHITSVWHYYQYYQMSKAYILVEWLIICVYYQTKFPQSAKIKWSIFTSETLYWLLFT